MDRRDFLKISAVGAAAGVLASCKNSESAPVSEGKMEYRPAGEDQLSLLGFGCMRWPMIKDAEGKDIVDQTAVDEMVDKAMANGVNLYDSSPVYLEGLSEAAAGASLSRFPRESYYVSTKLSVFSPRPFEECVQMYRNSLENYRTDYLDIYLLHAVKSAEDLQRRFIDNGILDFLLEERKKGHIRKLGISTHASKEGFDELMVLHEKYHWDIVLIQMNYHDWHKTSRGCHAEYLYQELSARNIPIMIMEPLLGGRLAKIPATAADILKADEPKRTTASWAFRFCGTYPGVTSVLSGMSNMEHLDDNLETFMNFEPLSEAQIEKLESVVEIIDKLPFVKCTDCKYCMPCPYGIDIPGIFKFYNNSLTDGTYAKGRKRFIARYNREIEAERQADHCIKCAKCMSHCPQRIKIPRELSRIDKYIEEIKLS